MNNGSSSKKGGIAGTDGRQITRNQFFFSNEIAWGLQTQIFPQIWWNEIPSFQDSFSNGQKELSSGFVLQGALH